MILSYGYITINGTNAQEVFRIMQLWYDEDKSFIQNGTTIQLHVNDMDNLIIQFSKGCELNHLLSLFNSLNYEFYESNLQIHGFFMNENEFMYPNRAYTLYFDSNTTKLYKVIAVSEKGRNYRVKSSGFKLEPKSNFTFKEFPEVKTNSLINTIVAKDYEGLFPFEIKIKTSFLLKLGFLLLLAYNLYALLFATSYFSLNIIFGILFIAFLLDEGFVKSLRHFWSSLSLSLLFLLSGIVLIHWVEAFKWFSNYEMLIVPSVLLIVRRTFSITFTVLFHTNPNFYFGRKYSFSIYTFALALFAYFFSNFIMSFLGLSS